MAALERWKEGVTLAHLTVAYANSKSVLFYLSISTSETTAFARHFSRSSQNHIMCYSHEIISDKIIINFEDERVTMNNKNDV